MTWPTPRLVVEKLPEPRGLRNALGQLQQTFAGWETQQVSRSEQAGRQWLARVRKTNILDKPPRRSWRFLIGYLSEKDASPQDREHILKAALRFSQILGWRRLWQLWESPPARQYRDDFARQLASKFEFLWEQNPKRFPQKIPDWLGTDSRAEWTQRLRYPETAIFGWWESQPVPLWELQTKIGCLTVTQNDTPGKEALVRILSDGKRRWLDVDRVELRWWAADTQSHEIIGRVADGLLCSIDSRETRQPAETLSVVGWVRNTLRDPNFSSGSNWSGPWEWVSEDGRKIWHRLRLKEEFEKILTEFRKSARETDRVNYWSKRFHQVKDAKYYETSNGVAVCMMVIGDTLVVEFGTLGNACYLYRAPKNPLLFATLPDSMKSEDFKNTYQGINMGGEQLGYRAKLSHFAGWEYNFDQKIS